MVARDGITHTHVHKVDEHTTECSRVYAWCYFERTRGHVGVVALTDDIYWSMERRHRRRDFGALFGRVGTPHGGAQQILKSNKIPHTNFKVFAFPARWAWSRWAQTKRVKEAIITSKHTWWVGACMPAAPTTRVWAWCGFLESAACVCVSSS